MLSRQALKYLEEKYNLMDAPMSEIDAIEQVAVIISQSFTTYDPRADI